MVIAFLLIYDDHFILAKMKCIPFHSFFIVLRNMRPGTCDWVHWSYEAKENGNPRSVKILNIEEKTTVCVAALHKFVPRKQLCLYSVTHNMSFTGFTDDVGDDTTEKEEGGEVRRLKTKKTREKMLATMASIKTSSVVGSSESLPAEARLAQPQAPTPVKMRVSGKIFTNNNSSSHTLHSIMRYYLAPDQTPTSPSHRTLSHNT